MSSNNGEQGFSILSSKNNGLKSPISNLKPFDPCVTNAIHKKDQLSYEGGKRAARFKSTFLRKRTYLNPDIKTQELLLFFILKSYYYF